VTAPGPGLPDWDSRKVGQILLDKAIGFIDQDKGKPFYIHLSTPGAHGPYTPPDTLHGTPVKGASKMTPHTDMVLEVDVIVGKIIEALEKRGLIENTLIVITSDNGGIPADRQSGHDAVGGLRGRKSLIWEGGHRVPLVFMWKGRIPAGAVRNQLTGAQDIVPTFVELAGGKHDREQMLDSVSLAPVLLGKRGDDRPVRRTLLIQSSPGRDAFTEKDAELPPLPAAGPRPTPQEREAARSRAWNAIARKGAKSGSHGMAHALREGEWKLVLDIEHDKPVALYNLADDLSEQKNLVADAGQAERVQRMDQLYREIRSSQRSTTVNP
jgi:arylsulfatase A-like enzyme